MDRHWRFARAEDKIARLSKQGLDMVAFWRASSLFEVDAVLLARGTSQVRGCPAIANVIIDQLRHGGSYVAAPQLVMQSGPLALIISGAAISVARRNLDGWHYVISRLDL